MRFVIIFPSLGSLEEEAHTSVEAPNFVLRQCLSFFLSHIWRFQSPVSLTRRQTEWLTRLTWHDFPNKNRICSVCFFLSITHSGHSDPVRSSSCVELPVPMDFWLFVYANQTPSLGGAVAIVAPRRCMCLIWQGLTSSWAAPWERGGFKLFYLSRSSHLPSGPLTPAP